MKVRITEGQFKRKFSAMKEGFRLDMLTSATSFKQRLAYCREMLGDPIGEGSSRIVFRIDDETVLKLAKNGKGIAQNLEEIRLGTEPYLSSFPKIMNGTDENNGLWIIGENVMTATEEYFSDVLGMQFKEMQEYIWAVFMSSKKGNNKQADDIIHHCYAKYEQNDDVMDLLNDIYELCFGFNNDIGDLRNIKNWGMCNRNGRTTMVILDPGFSNEIRDKYYSRR